MSLNKPLLINLLTDLVISEPLEPFKRDEILSFENQN